MSKRTKNHNGIKTKKEKKNKFHIRYSIILELNESLLDTLSKKRILS